MPEGHTVHRLARRLGGDLAGRVVAASSPQGRFVAGAAALDGTVVERTSAHGKHLFVDAATDRGPNQLHVHLGLFGRFRRRPAPPPDPVGAVRLRLTGEDRTWDLSGPTACELLDPDDVDRLVARLGPDPLRADADPERFVDRAGRSRRPIGAVLMDQSMVAGIGNVYRSELLFRAGIDPRRTARELTPDDLLALWDDGVALLRVGERLGRIVTVDPAERGEPARTPARLGRDERLYVYRRTSCLRCGATVARLELDGRRAYACRREQLDG